MYIERKVQTLPVSLSRPPCTIAPMSEIQLLTVDEVESYGMFRRHQPITMSKKVWPYLNYYGKATLATQLVED